MTVSVTAVHEFKALSPRAALARGLIQLGRYGAAESRLSLSPVQANSALGGRSHRRAITHDVAFRPTHSASVADQRSQQNFRTKSLAGRVGKRLGALARSELLIVIFLANCPIASYVVGIAGANRGLSGLRVWLEPCLAIFGGL